MDTSQEVKRKRDGEKGMRYHKYILLCLVGILLWG